VVTGLLLLVLTGLMWVVYGILMSQVTRRGQDGPGYLALRGLIQTLAAMLLFPNFAVLLSGQAPRMAEAAAFIFLAGVVNAIGISLMQRAMQGGHHGIVWTISQSAMAVPFITGAILYGEPTPPWRIAGVLMALSSLICFGMARSQKQAAPPVATGPSALPATADDPASAVEPPLPHRSDAWFFYAVASMFLLGGTQLLASIPSYWVNWSDEANIRIPVSCVANTIGFQTMLWARGGRMRLNVLGLAVLGACLGLISGSCLFAGLDRLQAHGMVSIGYPVAVATCTVGFALYSMLIIREHVTRWHLLGLLLGVSGVVLMAIKL
jgi:drug/metabolite transporter (DMT)-like permease